MRAAKRQIFSALRAALLLLSGTFMPATLFAQLGNNTDAPKDLAVIEVYDGPPIYLPEAEAPPAPREVETRVIKIKYKGSDDVRFERTLVRYSDETVISHGPFKEYYREGQLFCEGEFDHGKASGNWTYYHPNGQVAKEMSYVAGSPDGPVKVYNTEGKISVEREFKQGKRNGKWSVNYAEEGHTAVEQHYEAGLASGVWKTWSKGGQLRQEQTFQEGKLNGTTRQWSSAGEKRAEAEFADGKRHGKTTIWQPDGKVVEQIFEEGRLVSKKEIDE